MSIHSPNLELVLQSQLEKVVLLIALGETKVVVSVCNELLHKLKYFSTLNLQTKIAWLLEKKGEQLNLLNREKEAFGVFQEIERKFSDSKQAELEEYVGRAILQQAHYYLLNGRGDSDALCEEKIYNRIILRYSKTQNPILQQILAQALYGKGEIYWWNEQYKEALASYSEIVDRFGQNEQAKIIQIVSGENSHKSSGLWAQEQESATLFVCDDILQHPAENSEIADWINDTLILKGTILNKQNRHADALQAFNLVRLDIDVYSADEPFYLDDIRNYKSQSLILLAKQRWQFVTERIQCLKAAKRLLQISYQKSVVKYNRFEIIARLIYCFFLLGEEENARVVLKKLSFSEIQEVKKVLSKCMQYVSNEKDKNLMFFIRKELSFRVKIFRLGSKLLNI